jgi:hypothetical protein
VYQKKSAHVVQVTVKIHMEFNNLNADTVHQTAVQKYVFTIRKIYWWFVLTKALFPWNVSAISTKRLYNILHFGE